MNIQSDFLRASCRIRTNDPEITNHVLWPTELKRQRIYFNMFLFRASCRIRTNDPEITNHVLWPTELKRQGNIFQYVLFRASCRIRTNDPEITNHVLWWVSLPYRAATTNYLCCDQALEDSKGAGRMGLTHVMYRNQLISFQYFLIAGAKVGIFFNYTTIIE